MIEYQEVFGEKRTKNYSLFGNIVYNMRASYDFDRKLFWFQLLPIIPIVTASYLGTFIPSEVVRALQEQWNVYDMVKYICLLTLFMFLCNMIGRGMRVYVSQISPIMNSYYSVKCCRKMMDLDYDMLERKEEQKLIGNAWRTIRKGYDFYIACQGLQDCITALLAVVFYGIIIGRKNILLVVLMIVSVAMSMFLLSLARKKHAEYHVRLSRYSKEAAYISRQAIESSAGKDIRIYNMLDLFLKKYDEALDGLGNIFAGIHNWYFLRSLSDALIGFLVDAFAWGFLLWMLVQNKLTAAEFVLYLGLVSGFSAYLETFIRGVMQLGPMSVSISYLREFMGLRNRWGEDKENKEKCELENTVTIELCDVSYTYPGNETPTLSHVNLKINSGEKLAVLGLNGAGKTTLVKLICGFYQPTEGYILVNGRPITDYNREHYYDAISVLFQDAIVLPVSIDMNLTGQVEEKIDREKLEWALKMSGFYEKYQSLPEKGNTRMVRDVNENALDYSGGEMQKLLFARALYKESKLLILDEPTAALDPIAENELYQKFGEAAQGRTSIYISHRLSSTRFCDRIVLLENGGIVEEGTHESLMAGKSKYARLYELQSRYYKDREEKIRRSAIMGDVYIEDEEEKEGIFDE